MNKLMVYLPCYNEENNIAPLVSAWLSVEQELEKRGYELSITAVDDKSTDSTPEILRELSREHKELSVITHEKNMNLGGGLFTSIRSFLSCSGEGDKLCFMDADNTHKPECVLSMLDAMEGRDCVIASRYQPGAEVVGVPQNRLFMSDGARFYYSLVLHVPNVKDYTCGYRLYSREILAKAYEKYGDKLIEMKNFSCMMELLYKLHRCGCRFAEVPFILRYDEKGGVSKMRVLQTAVDSALLALKLRFRK